MFDRRNILGIPLDNLTMESTLEKIFNELDAQNSNNPPKYIATVNVDFIVNTLSFSYKNISDPFLYKILQESFLVTADGMPLVWTSKLLGNSISGRVTGSDLIPRLVEECAKKNKSIFLLGGKEEVNAKAKEILYAKSPSLKIVGTYSSIIKIEKAYPLQEEELDKKIIEEINSSKADILLIALGNPKQEYWYYKNAHRLKVKLAIGIGGTLDFISGNIKRAPKWMQRFGLEWIYRFMQEPSRMWKRYTKDIGLFLSLISLPILYYNIMRILYSNQSNSFDLKEEDKTLKVTLPKNFNKAATLLLHEQIKITNYTNIEFQFGNVKVIDNLSLAYLFSIISESKKKNIKIEFKKVSRKVRSFFLFNRLLPTFSEVIVL